MMAGSTTGIEIKDGQICVTRSKNKTKYYIPGGKREPGESDEACLIREIREELDVDIVPQSIRYVGTFQAQADAHAEGIEVKMTCYSADYQGTLKASSEIAELRWLHASDTALVSYVDVKIFGHLHKQGLLK
ncbi:MAG: NUDIX domain-containing protein [Bacteroidota bacterium]